MIVLRYSGLSEYLFGLNIIKWYPLLFEFIGFPILHIVLDIIEVYSCERNKKVSE